MLPRNLLLTIEHSVTIEDQRLSILQWLAVSHFPLLSHGKVAWPVLNGSSRIFLLFIEVSGKTE